MIVCTMVLVIGNGSSSIRKVVVYTPGSSPTAADGFVSAEEATAVGAGDPDTLSEEAVGASEPAAVGGSEGEGRMLATLLPVAEAKVALEGNTIASIDVLSAEGALLPAGEAKVALGGATKPETSIDEAPTDATFDDVVSSEGWSSEMGGAVTWRSYN